MAELPEARVVHDGGRHRDGGGEPPARLIQLAPRTVPRAVMWRFLFGSGPGQVGWLFVVVSLVFAILFMTQTSLRTPDYDGRTTATIIAVEDSHDSENDNTIYRVRYRFRTADEREITGASFTLDESVAMSPDEADARRVHDVEYVRARPEQSRLVGMRTAPFSKWIALIALMPLLGLVFALVQMLRGWKLLRLVRHGVEVRGKLVGTETIEGSDDTTEYRLTFEYDVGGTRHTFVVTEREPAPLQDDALEPMVYDPFDPKHATTLDNLPGKISIGANGEIVGKRGVAGWMLVLPVLSMAGMIALAIEMWRG